MKNVSDKLEVKKQDNGKFELVENFVSEASAQDVLRIRDGWINQSRQLQNEIKEMKSLLELKQNVVNSPALNYIYAKAGVVWPNPDELEIKTTQIAKLNRKVEELKPAADLAEEEIKSGVDVAKEIKATEPIKEGSEEAQK